VRHGYRFGKVLHTNSTTLLRDLTLRGFGISQMSREFVGEDLKAGRLRVVKTEKLPPMVYGAVYRTDTATPALRRIVELAVDSCDFVYRSGDRSAPPDTADRQDKPTRARQRAR
jgi:DNA-binding transcriptional LysR family regulator